VGGGERESESESESERERDEPWWDKPQQAEERRLVKGAILGKAWAAAREAEFIL